jgi:alcohol dehydrogenase class IV
MAESTGGDSLQPFEFRMPGILKFGWGILGTALLDVLRETGVERPLLVTDANVGKLPRVVQAVESVSSSVRFAGVFDAVPHEPTTVEVDGALGAFVSSGADGIVAIGGGSVIDTAKAAAMLSTNPGPLASYFGLNRFPLRGAPLIAVPTTSGTGSEATRTTIIGDPVTHAKLPYLDWKIVPSAAIVDPALAVTMPADVTANTGVDALTHGIEAYVSRRANPISSGLALSAIRRMVWAVPRAFADPEDREARMAAALGSLEAGLAFCNSSVALLHGMSRPLGAAFGVPHGASNAMLLGTVMAYSIPASPGRYRDIAGAMGLDVEEMDDLAAADRGLEAVKDLCRGLRIPSLAEYGISRAALEGAAAKMASEALASGSPANNPRIPTAEEIVELYLVS